MSIRYAVPALRRLPMVGWSRLAIRRGGAHPTLVGPLLLTLTQDKASGNYDMVRRANDTLPEISVVLSDQNGPVDLSGAVSVVLELTSQQTLTGIISTTVNLKISSTTPGKASALWPAGSLAAGDYKGTVRATWADGSTASFPDGTNLRILVLADL